MEFSKELQTFTELYTECKLLIQYIYKLDKNNEIYFDENDTGKEFGIIYLLKSR